MCLFRTDIANNPNAAGGEFGQYEIMQKKSERCLKPWNMGTHLRILSESYPMNTNITGFKWFSRIFASLCSGRKQSLHWKDYCKHVLGVLENRVIYQHCIEENPKCYAAFISTLNLLIVVDHKVIVKENQIYLYA